MRELSFIGDVRARDRAEHWDGAGDVRTLFTTQPGHGHLNQMLPYASVLRDAGHEVRLATAPSFCAAVRRPGFQALPAGHDFLPKTCRACAAPQARERAATACVGLAARSRAAAKVTRCPRSSSHSFRRTARRPSRSESIGTSWKIGFSSCARCRL